MALWRSSLSLLALSLTGGAGSLKAGVPDGLVGTEVMLGGGAGLALAAGAAAMGAAGAGGVLRMLVGVELVQGRVQVPGQWQE